MRNTYVVGAEVRLKNELARKNSTKASMPSLGMQPLLQPHQGPTAHEACCHPNPNTPKYWCTASDCKRSEYQPGAKPFFRKDMCEMHRRACSSLQAVRRMDIKEHLLTNGNSLPIPCNTSPSKLVQPAPARVEERLVSPQSHFEESYLQTSVDGQPPYASVQWPRYSRFTRPYQQQWWAI